MNNLWILTEERPKLSVIDTILKQYAQDFGQVYSGSKESLKITPIVQQGRFTFQYVVEGAQISNIKAVFIEIVSGHSSFVDYMVVCQKHRPAELAPNNVLMAIEETTTSDDESRNTGVSQRISKFVYLKRFYKDVKMYMLYNEELEARPDKKPSDTSIFGTNILLSLGVTILGKDISKWFAPFQSLDEMIAFKSNMRKPPKGNIPVTITKFADKIEVSGRLAKPADAGNIGHDPGIGTLSMIGAGLRQLGWTGNIVITCHGVSQAYVTNNPTNKFLFNCRLLGMTLDGLTMPAIVLPDHYWHYERKSEKVASIFLHLTGLYSGIKGIYENHAGCERSYFKTKTGALLALPKKDQNGNNLLLPDVVLCENTAQEIYNIEGKKLTTLQNGIEEVETYDAIENEYIKKHYPGYRIQRWVCVFGGSYQGIPHEKVLLYLNERGEVYINKAAPASIKAAFTRIGINSQ